MDELLSRSEAESEIMEYIIAQLTKGGFARVELIEQNFFKIAMTMGARKKFVISCYEVRTKQEPLMFSDVRNAFREDNK